MSKGITSNCLTPDIIDSVIVSAEYHVFKPSMLTVCCLTLSNGATVTGESVCALPEHHEPIADERIAYQNARVKVYALEGYLLKERMK